MFGELQPLCGGDTIPLLKKKLVVGRRESCDIVLRFANVSALHCELVLQNGYWYVKDLNSRNGTKVNGLRVEGEKRLDPGNEFSVAKHRYVIQYTPADLGAAGPPPADDFVDQIMGMSLLKRAGLDRAEKKSNGTPPTKPTDRYDLRTGNGGQFRDPDDIV
ncbi:MAG: FHA domain-containing protein [Planctomycetota bacterium]|nr:FHA domain-containing protein [Planctomycetota bacterium]MDA1177694.1 FHA domain-containing protein [Planctomycetota bacterium]